MNCSSFLLIFILHLQNVNFNKVLYEFIAYIYIYIYIYILVHIMSRLIIMVCQEVSTYL